MSSSRPVATPQSSTAPAVVIGGGIVGICCALYLQRAGHAVTVVDRGPAEDRASFGNAGYIANGSVVPESTPGIVGQVPGMLLNPLGPLTIRWSYLPLLTPWLLRFVAAGRASRIDGLSRALNALYGRALDDFAPLLEAAGCAPLVRQGGRLEVYGSEAGFAKTALKKRLLAERGVAVEVLEPDAVRAREPAITGPVYRGLLLPDAAHTVDPHALTLALAAHFTARGGEVRQAEVRGFDFAEGRVRGVATEQGMLPAALVVLAAGAHSKRLAAQLGARVPLQTERGYHVTLPQSGVTLNGPLTSMDYGFAMTPMAMGLRLAGTVELAGLNAPPNWARAERLIEGARRMFGPLNTEGSTRWMGHRPAMPDTVPVIGRSRRHDNAYFAFGHGHLGLTGAATTGRLIAEMATGQQPVIDTHPYRADRF